ncbi:MAG TPA: efflux RND transporter periplasmic adaptor subunit [Dissulfurispiraceae bacterium]|nr:efflux RND transporter periplasmic adaptor subunit [Dissulfurispiraceae bacterium]
MSRKKLFLLVIGVVVLLLAGVLVYSLFFKKEEIQILETATAGKGNLRGIIVETGIIKPQVGAVVKIGARATGTIMKMMVKVGDRVSKDQLVALIDDRELSRAVEQQRAALAEAKANHHYAKLTYERERKLLKDEYTTKDAVDRAKSQYEATSARIADITALMKQQETKLSYTRIHTPISGVVSDVTAQEGETVVAGLQVANLITVLDPTRLEMWIYVDETDISRVTPGQKTEYRVDTFPERVFQGTISQVYPQPVVKENIVYYLAIVKISAEDAALLKPEMTTTVKIVFSEKTDVLTVPNAAIKFEKGRQVAYRIADDRTVEKVEIKTGIRGEDRTEILSGLNEGDEIATKLILPFAKAADQQPQPQQQGSQRK